MLDKGKKMNIIKNAAADILGGDETEIIWDNARERLKDILSRYKNIPPKEKLHTDLIFPHIAVYKSLLEKHSDMAMEIMEKGEAAAARKSAKTFQNMVKLPFGRELFLKGFAAGCRSGFGTEAGFGNVVHQANSRLYKMDVTVCPYVKYWLLVTRSHFFQHYYPEIDGCEDYSKYGFNLKSQIIRIIVYPFIRETTSRLADEAITSLQKHSN